jgi:DNA-directed RNA polymerase specialized sigma subunit
MSIGTVSIPANVQFKAMDIQAWEKYKKSRSMSDRDALLRRMDSIIQSYVNKWVGPVPRDLLLNEAKMLAIKAFDTYDPKKGTALATHIINNLAPISRIVYTHQNVARLPENILLKTHAFNAAKEHLTATIGREPTMDELHQELGWSGKELQRMETYQRSDLIESVGGMNDSFYGNIEDSEDDTLFAIYMSLLPDEKKLLEYTTGYNGVTHDHPKLSNPEIMKRLGVTQAQLSYKKTLLTNKIIALTEGKPHR